MKSENAPCKNCEDRHYGCHASCEAYRKFIQRKPRAGKDAARDFLAEGAIQRKKPYQK